MVITILSAAGKKGILKLVDLASLQFKNHVLWFLGYTVKSGNFGGFFAKIFFCLK